MRRLNRDNQNSCKTVTGMLGVGDCEDAVGKKEVFNEVMEYGSGHWKSGLR